MKEHLFARICRTSGRFMLSAGTVLLLAGFILYVFPMFSPDSINISSLRGAQNSVVTGPLLETDCIGDANLSTDCLAPAMEQPDNNIALGALGISVSALIILCLVGALRGYNNTLRSSIAAFAKFCHLEIHSAEILLSTIIWFGVTLAVFSFDPLYAILIVPLLVANDLLFLFGWVAYGCPEYTL